MDFTFEIIGFFLFVGGMGYLLFSGRIANMFRDRAPKPLLLIAAITAFAFYHWVGILSEPMPAAESPAPHPSAELPPPDKPAIVRHPVRTAKPTAEPPAPPSETQHWQTTIVQEGTPEQVIVPQAGDPSPAIRPTPVPPPLQSGSDPYESKAKRGLKAVGRFLHLRKTPN